MAASPDGLKCTCCSRPPTTPTSFRRWRWAQGESVQSASAALAGILSLFPFHFTVHTSEVLNHSVVQVKGQRLPLLQTDSRELQEGNPIVLDTCPFSIAFMSLGCFSSTSRGGFFELQGLSYQGHFHNQSPPSRSLTKLHSHVGNFPQTRHQTASSCLMCCVSRTMFPYLASWVVLGDFLFLFLRRPLVSWLFIEVATMWDFGEVDVDGVFFSS